MTALRRFVARCAGTVFVRVSFARPGLLDRRSFTRFMSRLFSRLAPSYDRLGGKLAPEAIILGPLKGGLSLVAESPAWIADLACGTGLATVLLGRRFPASQIVGADISEAMIRELKKKRAHSFSSGRFALVCNSARLPFGTNRFDLVTLQNAPPYLEEMVRILRPGGRLVLAYSFVFVPLVKGGVTDRLEKLGLERLEVVKAEAGMAFTARKRKAGNE